MRVVSLVAMMLVGCGRIVSDCPTGACVPDGGSVSDGGAMCSARLVNQGIEVRRAGSVFASGTISAPATITAFRGDALDFDVAGESWTVTVRGPSLPSTLRLAQGQVVQLDVHAFEANIGLFKAPTQLVAISRGSELLVFGLTARTRTVTTADFVMSGLSAPVTITNLGAECSSPPRFDLSSACGRSVERARVTVGTMSVDLSASTTGALGPFDVTVAAYEGVVDTGFCDDGGSTDIVGVRVR